MGEGSMISLVTFLLRGLSKPAFAMGCGGVLLGSPLDAVGVESSLPLWSTTHEAYPWCLISLFRQTQPLHGFATS